MVRNCIWSFTNSRSVFGTSDVMVHVQRFICLWTAGFCALSRSSFCRECSTELQKHLACTEVLNPCWFNNHSILTLTGSVVAVQDFTADRVQLHSSHGHSSAFHHFTNGTERSGCFPSLPLAVRGALAGKRADFTGITVSSTTKVSLSEKYLPDKGYQRGFFYRTHQQRWRWYISRKYLPVKYYFSFGLKAFK